MIKSTISREESILQNLETWCYEVDSRFEQMSLQAVDEFSIYANKSYVTCDLGCGDGAATRYLRTLGYPTMGVDINEEKTKNLGIVANVSIDEYVFQTKRLGNVFAHHSFEHVINIEDVIKIIGRKMNEGATYYTIVPAKDYLHSVHHVVFESAEELLPPGLTPIKMEYQERNEPEFICIAQKLL